jgi:hypothetical protein
MEVTLEKGKVPGCMENGYLSAISRPPVLHSY